MIDMHEGVPKLSASRISTYRLCARKYQYTYLDKEENAPQIENTAALLGTALHKAIELYYSENANPNTTFQRVFNDTMTEWQDTNVDIRGAGDITDMFKEGKRIIGIIEWDTFKPRVLEEHFLLPFPSADNPMCYIEGLMDMITEDERIIDHKSKKGKAPDITAIAHDPQFVLYYWAYMQLNEGKRPKGVYWHHLRSGVAYNTHVNDDFEEKLAQVIQDIKAMLTSQHFARKPMDNLCKNYCAFFHRCYRAIPTESTDEVGKNE